MFMFGFFKERRARAVVQSTLPSLPEGIQLLGRVDRAATLAIANAMLEAGADTWGPQVLRNPNLLPKPACIEAVLVLANHHGQLRTQALEPMQRRNMEDVAYAQAMRELRATELLIGTLGASLVDGRKPAVNEAWKLLWESRDQALDGAKALVDFAKHAKALPVPKAKARPGKTMGADLVRLASTLPPFLRRKPAKAAADPAARAKPKAIAPPAAPSRPAKRVAGR